MTDSLRDRIAAVICGMDALHAKQWSLDVADAVIRELLQKRSETGEIVDRDGGEPIKYGRHRYVTEWETDD